MEKRYKEDLLAFLKLMRLLFEGAIVIIAMIVFFILTIEYVGLLLRMERWVEVTVFCIWMVLGTIGIAAICLFFDNTATSDKEKQKKEQKEEANTDGK